MGIISNALKKSKSEQDAARKRRSRPDRSGPVVDVPSFGGILGPAEAQRVFGEDRARRILEGMPALDERVVAIHESEGVISEQFRALRTRLLNQNQENDHRVLAVTSCAPKEGKSVTSINLAFIFSEVKHLRILLVDGDLRRGRLAQMLDLKPSVGFADLIQGRTTEDEAICETAVPNLSFLAAGNTGDANAAEILSSARARSTFDSLRKRFHYVIVDTPPIITVADVGIIGQMCFGVILLVRMHQTREQMVKRAVKMLQANNINTLGCLVVGRHEEIWPYGYYYQDYRRYYYSRENKT